MMNEFDTDYFKCPRCGIYMLKHDDNLHIKESGVCSDCYYELQNEFYECFNTPEPSKYIKKPSEKSY